MKKAWIALTTSLVFFASASTVSASQPELEDKVEVVIGTPYKWGGTSIKGFDCSGFILYIFGQYDIKLPRTSATQALEGVEVAEDELRTGDLVFFNTSGKGISHAGIYIGDGQFAHSSSSKGVTVSKLSDKYYEKRYVTARRVVPEKQYKAMINDQH